MYYRRACTRLWMQTVRLASGMQCRGLFCLCNMLCWQLACSMRCLARPSPASCIHLLAEAALLKQVRQRTREEADESAAPGGAAADPGAVPAAADFQLFGVLAALLLRRAEALAAGGAAGDEEAAAELAAVVRWVGLGLTTPPLCAAPS